MSDLEDAGYGNDDAPEGSYANEQPVEARSSKHRNDWEDEEEDEDEDREEEEEEDDEDEEEEESPRKKKKARAALAPSAAHYLQCPTASTQKRNCREILRFGRCQ